MKRKTEKRKSSAKIKKRIKELNKEQQKERIKTATLEIMKIKKEK